MERSTFLVFFSLAICGGQPISGETWKERPVVQVIVKNPSAVEWTILSMAKLVVAGILSEAGVQLRWFAGERQGDSNQPAVTITFSACTPGTLLPGAMGYALPYATGGVRITLFLDRMQPVLARSPNTRGAILGHVIAHELVHVLQGIGRHSDSGLMKGRWSEDDFQQMGVKPLGLAPGDLALITSGLARRGALTLTVAP